MPRSGRPTKLTQQLQKAIAASIQKHCTPLEVAAAAAGVDRSTVFEWLQRGRAEKSGQYVDFAVAIDRARAKGTEAMLASIAKAGKTSRFWQARAWILERTQPKRFGLQVRVNVEEELRGGMRRLTEAFKDDPATLERALNALAGEPGEGGNSTSEAATADRATVLANESAGIHPDGEPELRRAAPPEAAD